MKMKKLLVIAITIVIGVLQLNAQKSKLKVGKKAPLFDAEILGGEQSVRLEDMLKNNDYVVVHFFIGSWHKYDTAYLANLQSIYTQLKSKNTEVIAFTREKPIYLNKMKENLGIEFIIGLDSEWYTMSNYGVATKITPNYVPLKHKEYNTLNAKHTGSKDGMIPVPATFIIDKERKITWMHYDQDYRRRPDVNEILNQL